MAKYHAKLYGSGWASGPEQDFDTITAARKWAEEYGTTADSCTIKDKAGRVVAEHRRDMSGNGERWFRAAASP